MDFALWRHWSQDQKYLEVEVGRKKDEGTSEKKFARPFLIQRFKSILDANNCK
jgi:hypothetical protein